MKKNLPAIKIATVADAELACRAKQANTQAAERYPAKPPVDYGLVDQLTRAEQRLDRLCCFLTKLSGSLSYAAPKLSDEIYAAVTESFDRDVPVTPT